MLYTLDSFVRDLDRITRKDIIPAAIVRQVAPLLQDLLKSPVLGDVASEGSLWQLVDMPLLGDIL